MRKTIIAFLGACSLLAGAAELLETAEQFRTGTLSGVTVSSSGLLELSPDASGGTLLSRVIDLGAGKSLRFPGWVGSQLPKTTVTVQFRSSPEPFAADSPEPAWRTLPNSVPLAPNDGRFVQYRVRLARREADKSPFLREILLGTRTLNDKFRDDSLAPKSVPELTMMMLYSVTPEKLFQVYSQLPYDASERGLYIFRNPAGKTIGEEYRYLPGENEMYLPMRYGTRILARFHPVATFSAASLRPKDVILRSKDGREKTGLREQHRTVNFFDEAFMREYLTGFRAAVRYYRDNNPYLFGYTLMSPEFFYDTEPWPQMTYLSGFSPEAFASYRDFMKKLGRGATGWPAVSDGGILLDADSYLWSYWRSRAGADYIAKLARIIKEENPAALAGTMHYVGAQSLRGLEPGFIELNPDFDFYYSSNIYPRVPGPDGLDGGTTFSYTRLNTLGHSRKLNLLEYDLWSPYVDETRALTYARYAALEGVHPVPIVLGDYPGNRPSNHLTRYHGMKGSALTPELLNKLAKNVNEVKQYRTSGKYSDVAVILPSISLFAVLEKDRWLPHRLQQLQLHILKPLLELNASFDFLTEGYVSKELLDRYRLVIVLQPAVYPWMREALTATSADILALGWAGSVAAPGPKRLQARIAPEEFDFTLSHAWPKPGGNRTIFPTGGKIAETATTLQFETGVHPLLAGLSGLAVPYDAPGLEGRPLPHAAGMSGKVLARNGSGEPVFTLLADAGRSSIHFGGLLHCADASGNERPLLSPEQERQFFRNILDFAKAEYYPDAGPLRLMRNGEWLLIENTSPDRPYRGPLPRAVNPRVRLPEGEVDLAPLGSAMLPLRGK
ncbi:MAG: hypothetical protein HPZ91_02275 [Lentisphaeria bacterium]|nr:hypothetical protein [Lentisphaeria bacterium]